MLVHRLRKHTSVSIPFSLFGRLPKPLLDSMFSLADSWHINIVCFYFRFTHHAWASFEELIARVWPNKWCIIRVATWEATYEELGEGQ